MNSNPIKHRQIRTAIDSETGEIIEAEELDNEYYAKLLRKEVNNNQRILICLSCENELSVGKNRINPINPTYYFYHRKVNIECETKSKDINFEEQQKLDRIYKSKETPEHKRLKQDIYTKLKNIEGVNPTSLKVEKWHIKNGKLVRRPDVYCEYKDHKIAFEVQISELSYRYMLERYNSYKEEGLHVIWVVEYFNFEQSRQFLIDIAELNSYFNIFILYEDSNELNFKCCYYKLNKVNDSISDKITKEIITFSQLQFDQNFQVFYYNYPKQLRRIANQIDEVKHNEEVNKQKRIDNIKNQEQHIKLGIENNWLNKWCQLLEQHEKPNYDLSNYYLTQDVCVFFAFENLNLFLPNDEIIQSDVQSIELNNKSVVWLVHSNIEESTFENAIENKLAMLEEEFPLELRKKVNRDYNLKLDYIDQEIQTHIDKLRILRKKIQAITNDIRKIENLALELYEALGGNKYFKYYEIEKKCPKLLKSVLRSVINEKNDLTQKIRQIEVTIEKYNSLPRHWIDDKELKLVDTNLSKEQYYKNAKNLTIVTRNTLNSLYKEIIYSPSETTLESILLYQNNYAFLFNDEELQDRLKQQVQDLTNKYDDKCNKEIRIKLILRNIIERTLKTLNKDLFNDAFVKIKKIRKLKIEYKNIINSYERIVDDYRHKEDEINEKYEDCYLNWDFKTTTWNKTRNPVFFDTGFGLFYLKEKLLFKKITEKEFIKSMTKSNSLLDIKGNL